MIQTGLAKVLAVLVLKYNGFKQAAYKDIVKKKWLHKGLVVAKYCTN